MKVKNLVITGIALLVLVIIIVFGYRAYINGETSLSIAQMSKKKILITYYTRTNDTSKMADTIHSLVGGDMIKIEPEIAYPADKEAYTKRVSDERAKRTIVPLKTSFPNLKQYKIIFVGTPTPIGITVPPVKSFLVKNSDKLKNKIIIPFIVYQEPNQAMGAFRDITYFVPDSYVKNPYFVGENITGSKKVSTERWLTSMRFKRYELK